MRMRTYYETTVRRLGAAGIQEPEREAELLLEDLLGLDRVHLFLDNQQEIPAPLVKKFEGWLDRRCGREPLAYILGEQEFWSLPFTVTPAVLIPRPETELLVEAALRVVTPASFSGPVLDIGTGSGAIAVVLARELPRAQVFAVDRSPEALVVAIDNSRRHGVGDRIHFFAADLVVGLRSGFRFPLVVSNPPYVDREILANLQPEVRDFEPHQALDGGVGGLHVISRFPALLEAVLEPGGWFFMEIGYDQESGVMDLFGDLPFLESVRVLPDLAGLPRILQARCRTNTL